VNKKNKKNKIDEEEHEAGLTELPVDTHATSDMPISSSKPKPKKEKDGTGRRVGPHARPLHCSTLCRLLGTVKLRPVTISNPPMRNLIP
jgi:hypothetical protein